MARVGTGSVSISALNSVFGLGNSLGSYKRTSTSVKSNTIALAPVGNTVSMNRLKGSYASGTYRDINVYASSTTAGVNVIPQNTNQAYNAGLSNNSDPTNAYTVFYGQNTGNIGYPTTCNTYRQNYYTSTDDSQPNGMYFRISNTMFPYAGPFEEEGAWVAAIGLNYYGVYQSTLQAGVYIYDFKGGGSFFYGSWFSTFANVFNGNYFFAVYVYSGTLYFGMVNRAQLRAGVIQPIYGTAMSGLNDTWWYNSILNACMRYSLQMLSAPDNLDMVIGWDEYLVRGYDLPPENRLYGLGDTATRYQVVNSGSAQYVDGRVFE